MRSPRHPSDFRGRSPSPIPHPGMRRSALDSGSRLQRGLDVHLCVSVSGRRSSYGPTLTMAHAHLPLLPFLPLRVCVTPLVIYGAAGTLFGPDPQRNHAGRAAGRSRLRVHVGGKTRKQRREDVGEIHIARARARARARSCKRDSSGQAAACSRSLAGDAPRVGARNM